jgi:hypothetical protein
MDSRCRDLNGPPRFQRARCRGLSSGARIRANEHIHDDAPSPTAPTLRGPETGVGAKDDPSSLRVVKRASRDCCAGAFLAWARSHRLWRPTAPTGPAAVKSSTELEADPFV